MNAIALTWPWITIDCGGAMIQHIFRYHQEFVNTSLCGSYTIVGEDKKPIKMSAFPHDEDRGFSTACAECTSEWNDMIAR